MRQMVGKILRTYGTAMTLSRDGEVWEIFAFFQPVRSKSWQYLEGNFSPLGEVPRGQYVYIGPTGQPVQAGETLEVGGKDYLLRRVEPVYYGQETAYYWGMCVEKGGEDTWGQS